MNKQFNLDCMKICRLLTIDSCQHMCELAKHATPDGVLEHFDPLLTLFLQVLHPDPRNMWLDTLIQQFLLGYNFETLRFYLHQSACSQPILGQASIWVEG